jgi:hypothetical protein
MALMMRLVHRLRTLCRRMRAAPAPALRQLRWCWPVLLHAGAQWAASRTEAELRTAPLTPLCFLWLLDHPMKMRRPTEEDEDVLQSSPRTLLERLMLTVAWATEGAADEDSSLDIDEYDMPRRPVLEAEVLSQLRPCVGEAHLYAQVGVWECGTR